MPNFLQPTALDISTWANQVESKSKFPELIRRLILATAGYLLQIDFPSGDNTYESGWDGIVTDAVGNVFIPEGQSAWELGTNKSKKAKAESDYKERTSNPLGIIPAETSFVLVTPRNWSANTKRDWVAEKTAENVWKAVRLLDAKDLEVWLSIAPAVQYWFAHLIGKPLANVVDLESYWLDWAAATAPVTPESLLTLGRQKIVDEVLEWLKGSDSSLSLRADSRPEALAVFIAAVKKLPENEQLIYFSRCLVIFDSSSWREIVSSSSQLILIPLFTDRTVIGGAMRQDHRVFVPLDRADTNWKNKALEIPRLPRTEVDELLLSLGFPREKAGALAGIARRSFAAFRRAITQHAAIAVPDWVYTENQSVLVAALLIGAWDEQYEQDKEVVAQVAATAYPLVKSQLVRWLATPDPPVRLVGSTWFIVDKGDVWGLLAESITQEQLERFTQVMISVLGSIPPRYDLPPTEWYRASIHGKESPFSGTLRENLTTTLAYMGSLEDPLPVAGVLTSDLATQLVTQLLRAANADWRIWSALSHNLRWLAEAAPTAFLEAVNEGLTGSEPVVMKLFDERKDLLNTSSDHPGLLWALELLAWSPRYLVRTALTLAKLVRLDPGGGLNNRPLNSLREIFLTWYPHTAATLEQRLQALDELRRQEPNVAGRLLALLVPTARGISTGTATPRWRDWVPTHNITRREVHESTLAIQQRVLRDANQDVARWESIIKDFPNLPNEQQELVITQLRELSKELAADADRVRLRDQLRELVSRHRSFHDTDWAMPPTVIERLVEVMEMFEPTDIISKHAWLFTDWPLLPEGREQDSKVYAALIGEQQRQALAFIYATGGLAVVLSFIPFVKSPMALGRTLVQAGLESEAQALELTTKYLKSENEENAAFGLGIASALVAKYSEAEQLDWLDTILASYSTQWSAIQQAEWLRLVKACPRTWQKVSELLEDGQRYYWLVIPYFFIDDADTEQAAELFLIHQQPGKAVELLGQRIYQKHPVPSELATRVLEHLLYTPVEAYPSSYVVETILESLAEAPDIDRERVIRLEFHFLAASYNYRTGNRSKLIYQELGTNPGLFAELVTRVFRAEGEETRILTPEDSNMNIASWELLDSWRIIPGTDIDGNINPEYLFDWVTKVQTALQQSNRQKIGDEQIGQLLSGSPKGSDGAWPHEAVRALIEKAVSPDIERGFTIGHYNSRGTTIRGPYEGGVQERDLAQEYYGYATSIEFQSHRTAELLRRIAQDYERQAKREDDEASLNQDLY